jgi:CDP-paratose 2-epimerase
MTPPSTFLVTGGAGFIGCNLAHALAGQGHRVRIYDNLSRGGVIDNLSWLSATHGDRIATIRACVTDRAQLQAAIEDVDAVFHLAAQVAVTTSLLDPIGDFQTNLRGTVELLEAARTSRRPPAVLFTSTNKVYGCLADLTGRAGERRFEVSDPRAAMGISERRPLEFRSPYGCSKGAADQYVLDYANTFGLRAAVFRMSCIYGPRQLGSEAQGWVAHLLLSAIAGRPITVFGDGKQVRDVLFIDDLVDALLLGVRDIEQLSGQAFNIGGGPDNTLSLLELVDMIEELLGHAPGLAYESWRPADQHWYVSDIRRFTQATAWRPRVGVREGVERLSRWLRARSGRRLEA